MKLILLALVRDYKHYWGKTLFTLTGFILSLTLFLVIELFVDLLKDAQKSLTISTITHRVMNKNGKLSTPLIQNILNKTDINEWVCQEKAQDIWTKDQTYNVQVSAYNSHKDLIKILKNQTKSNIKINKEDWSKWQNKGLRNLVFLIASSKEKKVTEHLIKSEITKKQISIIQIPKEKKGPNIAFMDLALFEDFYSTKNYLSAIGITIKKENEEKIKKQLKTINPQLTIESINIHQEKKINWLQSLNYNLKFLALIALVVSISLSLQCFNFIQDKRKKLIQTLLLIGVKPRYLNQTKALELLIIGTITTLLAIIFAVIIAKLSLDIFNQFIRTFYFHMDAKTIIITSTLIIKAFCITTIAFGLSYLSIKRKPNPPSLGILLLISLTILSGQLYIIYFTMDKIIGIIGTIITLATLLIISICISALIPYGLKKIKTPTFWRFKLASESMQKAWQDFGTVCFGMALAIGLIFSMLIYVNSFKASFTNWLNATLTNDIYIQNRWSTIQNSLPIDKKTVAKIKNLFNKESIQTISKFKLEWNKNPITINAITNYYSHLPDDSTFKSKDKSLGQKNTIIVSEAFQLKLNKSLNDTILIPGITKKSLHIAGITYDYVSEFGTIFIPKELLTSPAQAPIHGIAIKRIDQKTLIKLNTIGRKENLSIQNQGEIKQESQDIFDDTFKFIWFIVGLNSLLTLFSLMNLITLINSKRKKELQKIWLLGANQKELTNIVLSHVKIIILISSLLALVIGFSLYICLVYGIQKPTFSWTIFMNIPALKITAIIITFWFSSILVTKLINQSLSKSFQKGAEFENKID